MYKYPENIKQCQAVRHRDAPTPSLPCQDHSGAQIVDLYPPRLRGGVSWGPHKDSRAPNADPAEARVISTWIMVTSPTTPDPPNSACCPLWYLAF